MHEDEREIDVDLVRRLLAAQFPAWASRPVRRVPSAGTDNAMFRLGDDLVVRMPRIGWAVADVAREQTWLPRLAPFLPVSIPEPVALGEPAAGYPWPWSVYRWLEGENPAVGEVAALPGLAIEIAAFVDSLHRAAVPDGPACARGGPLAEREAEVRAAVSTLRGVLDAAAVTAVWDRALAAPPWSAPRVWSHGDLSPLNLLVRNGHLSAVIDFGCVGVGDPACDLIPAWNLLDVPARAIFRAALAVDDATWARGRGWALSIALVALPYYEHTNQALADSARHVIRELVAEGPD
jgi:aminoglycoside phosphotransferase (APT) family kinase protein